MSSPLTTYSHLVLFSSSSFLIGRKRQTKAHMHHLQQKVLLFAQFARTSEGKVWQVAPTTHLASVWEDLIGLNSYCVILFYGSVSFCFTAHILVMQFLLIQAAHFSRDPLIRQDNDLSSLLINISFCVAFWISSRQYLSSGLIKRPFICLRQRVNH